MNLVIIGASLIGFIIIGVGTGFLIHKISVKIKDRKIKKDALKVIKGEKPNEITLENGKKQEVSRFIVYNKENKPTIIDLKGEKIETQNEFPNN